MDMGRNRPSYEYESSFWPLPEIMVIVVRTRNYNYIVCDARQEIITIIIVASISGISNC